MTTNGELAITLNDWRKRLAPDGNMDEIIEVLATSNPILQDMPFMEGNLSTGNVTTQRNSIPLPSIRDLNQGTKPAKSGTKQIADTITCFENFSRVDEKFKDLQPDFEMFRRSEDMAIIEGFGQEVAKNVFYGDSMNAGARQFNGLSVRLANISASSDPTSANYTVLGNGGTTADSNCSAYLVNWGSRLTTGFFPKNGAAGLKHQDLGKQLLQDSEGRMINYYVSQFNWDVGMTVRDPRSVGALRNIDNGLLTSATSAQKATFMGNLIRVHDRMRKPEETILYVAGGLYTLLKLAMLDKNNVNVEQVDMANGIRELRFDGMPVRKLDCLTTTEAVID